MQIFTIVERLGLMNRYPCYMDDTFKLCASLKYGQVFIISVKRENKDGEHFSFPVACAFMPNSCLQTESQRSYKLPEISELSTSCLGQVDMVKLHQTDEDYVPIDVGNISQQSVKIFIILNINFKLIH